jgi:hypothetical protein
MFMPLNIFGKNIQLRRLYTLEYLRHNHSTWMVKPLTFFGITIQL